MNEDTAYVVEIRELPGQDEEELVENLIRVFGIRREKAERILRRVPGVMSKPLRKEEAERTASLFVEAGLAAFARPEGFTGPGLRAFTRPVRTQDEKDWSFEPPSKPASKSAKKREGGKAVRPVGAARADNLRLKLLGAILLPTLLVLVVALGAVYWLVGEAMRAQRLEAAYALAVTTAASLAGPLAEDAADLTGTVSRVREARLPALHLLLLLDASGAPLAGWYGDGDSSALPPALLLEARALARGPDGAPVRLHDETQLALAAHPVSIGDTPVASLVLGLDNSVAPLPTVLLLILLSGLVPLLLGLLLALGIARSLTARDVRT